MKKLMIVVKRYRYFLFMLAVLAVLLAAVPTTGSAALSTTLSSLSEMALLLPPIFILLGLLDVWVPRSAMVKFMGKDAGLLGWGTAFFLGSAAAGPLYAAFPIAAMLLKKGAALKYVFIFLGAWSTTKIPQLLFEVSNLGFAFTALQLALNIAGITIMAFALERMLNSEEKEAIIKKAEELE